MYKFFSVISDVIKYNQCKKAGVKQMLISYYYLMKNDKLLNLLINDKEIEIIVDSGLYSFSNSVKINEHEIAEYKEKYFNFVKKIHNIEQFKGFFELDFDLIGYDYHSFVKPIQEEFLKITGKMILITQKNRTIDDIRQMTRENINCIAIPFASSVERNYFDYNLIIDIIHDAGKRVHLLGCGTIDYLVNVEQSDSSSWFMSAAMGEETRLINGKMTTFHYTESEQINDDYHSRAINNAKFYATDFQNIINKKKEEPKSQLRLF